MTTLLVCERFQALTWLALGCALVSLSLSLWGIERSGARGALNGIVVGEMLSLAGVIWLGWRERSRRA